ncbi:MAG: maltose alpha-D-glucosyltransferase [Gammaproteobacteria bacterium]
MRGDRTRKSAPDPAAAPPERASDPHWYRDAVIYELHVKAFHDANGDGIGDFPGLADKLDYVADLGVNTLWLLPFYPSPFRDDGYDVSDYHNVHPAYGTRQDFRHFVREAHRRGLRVITELVVNHTSDQHPWFQAARRAPRGSDKRNFYVWSDDPDRYGGTRIIFTDTEKSNWAWDDVAGQYYWHRFFSHQPDLNFDNPHVRKAIFRILRFWLDMGVDGFRLDAIPYLVERDGTSNENLRETHEVIKELRRGLDERYPDRLFLAEANMWPEDVREYFGDGDECHMAYHFPLMPRMFMAIAMEDRHPIVDILQQTPEIPQSCQWAVFLRNHDELTLEMVTDRERDYMWNMYASDKRARINLGIRRRLAPLMENDRDRIKLMNSLLLSMPGSPIIYYGDEIGMGDNIFLGDRDGVRTPMQWTSDRNGGFSRADPQRLYLPPIQDPVYGFEAINVESQLRAPSSLLNWTRRMLAVRKTSPAFGRGDFRFLHPGNRKILAYTREYGDEVILCVANVSRSAQPVELDLARFKGRVPIEMTGRQPFPPIGDLPYLLTLAAHGFYWFRLAADAPPPDWHEERGTADDLPSIVLFDEWNSFFRERAVPWRIGMAERTRARFENEVLPQFVARQRWYAAKGEPARNARIVDSVRLDFPDAPQGGWLLVQTEVAGAAGTARYLVPLALLWEGRDDERIRQLGPAALAKVRQQAKTGLLADAGADPALCHAVVEAIGAGREISGPGGILRFVPTAAFARLAGTDREALNPVRAIGQSSNTVVMLGERLFVKWYRRLRAGENLELEMGRHLTEVAGFEHCVPVAGSVDHVAQDGTVRTLALVQGFVANQGDAWSATVDHVAGVLEASRDYVERAVDDASGGFLDLMGTLGRRTAEMHAALSRITGNPAFDPESVSAEDVDGWIRGVRAEAAVSIELLAARLGDLDPGLVDGARRLVAVDPAGAIGNGAQLPLDALKTRTHGDYHLGQVLMVRNDFVIIDFEGEPDREIADRRRKQSPLRDVAGMLRSFDYARQAALLRVVHPQAGRDTLDAVAAEWGRRVREAYLRIYRDTAIARGLFRNADHFESLAPLLRLFEIEKAFYELRYELTHRPDWAAVPVSGLMRLFGLGPHPTQ